MPIRRVSRNSRRTRYRLPKKSLNSVKQSKMKSLRKRTWMVGVTLNNIARGQDNSYQHHLRSLGRSLRSTMKKKHSLRMAAECSGGCSLASAAYLAPLSPRRRISRLPMSRMATHRKVQSSNPLLASKSTYPWRTCPSKTPSKIKHPDWIMSSLRKSWITRCS